MKAKKSVNMKIVVLMLAVVLLIGCVAGGTFAYLMTKSTPVTNTFVAGQIGTLTLDETGTEIQTNGTNTYVIIPGKTITKDPTISYTLATSNDVGEVYVFVEVTGGSWTYNKGSNTFVADDLSWTVAGGWTHLSENVFYLKTSTAIANKPFIADNAITVSSAITKGDDMNAAVNAANGLTFTAYAIQAEGFKDDNAAAAAAAAWAQAKTAAN